MKRLALIDTNPYLKQGLREKLVTRSVASSCGVEGFSPDFNTPLDMEIPRRPKRIYRDAS